jgi:hypothetical protein
MGYCGGVRFKQGLKTDVLFLPPVSAASRLGYSSLGSDTAEQGALRIFPFAIVWFYGGLLATCPRRTVSNE